MIRKALIVSATVAASVALSGCGMIYPPYRTWEQEQNGKAEFARAVQNRRIKVLEAQANLESAKLNAQAEIVRAKGTDEANRIMAHSLGGPENYLTWAYIDMLRDTAGKDRTVIYIPTEAGVPILESGKRPNPAQ